MVIPNPAYIDELMALVSGSPFPKHMAMKLTAIGFDHAEVEMFLAEFHLQPYGIVHGGVLATLVDTATFWAAFLRIPEDAGLVNVDLKLNYLKPVVIGSLRAEGVCLRSGRSISYSETRVFDEEDGLVAHGTSTLMTIPGKGLKLKNPKFLEKKDPTDE